MKYLSVTLGFGLFLNVLFVLFIWQFSALFPTHSDMYGTGLSYVERETISILSALLQPFCIAIIVQVFSVLILFKFPKLGLTLAILSAIIMLPLSFVFIVGYLYSYENSVNRVLTPYNSTQDPDIRILFRTNQIKATSAFMVVAGIICLFIGFNLGGLLLIVGIVRLCNAVRLNNKFIIGLYNDNLILTPNAYANTYLIPLNTVSVIENGFSSLELSVSLPELNKKFTVKKDLLAGEDFSQVLEKIVVYIPKSNVEQRPATIEWLSFISLKIKPLLKLRNVVLPEKIFLD
nr:hypothetical protein [Providencia alcalifaciens]